MSAVPRRALPPRPDRKVGYTQVPHPLLEGMNLAPFHGAQVKIVLAAVRRSLGWGRETFEAGYADWQRDTGLSRTGVRKAIGPLLEEGVLLIEGEHGVNRPTTYRLETDPRRWGSFSVDPPSLAGDVAPMPPQRHTPMSPQRHTPPTSQEEESTEGVSPGRHTPMPPGSHTPPYATPETQGYATTETHKHRKERKLQSSSARENEKPARQEPPTSRIPFRETELRAWLGDDLAAAIDAMNAVPGQSPTWAGSVYADYVDQMHGSRWGGVLEADRPTILSGALSDYAGTAQAYNPRLFAGFVRDVKEDPKRRGRRTPKEGTEAAAVRSEMPHEGRRTASGAVAPLGAILSPQEAKADPEAEARQRRQEWSAENAGKVEDLKARIEREIKASPKLKNAPGVQQRAHAAARLLELVTEAMAADAAR